MTGRALLTLLRIPNVFTAVANVTAGVVIARGGRFELRDVLLCLASSALYLAGMVLNDVFDRKVDAEERPERPIPSGQVSFGAAIALGTMLIGIGLVLSASHSSLALGTAVALTAAILLYDGGLKSTALGPLVMGSCRFLNLLVGLAAVGHLPVEAWMWIAPITMGAYTAAITALSRDEVAGAASARGRVYLIAAILLLALVGLLTLSPVAGTWYSLSLIPLVAFLWARAKAVFAPLLTSASGPLIGRAIGGGILLMPALDAAMVAAGGWLIQAGLVFALMIPATVLKRTFYMT